MLWLTYAAFALVLTGLFYAFPAYHLAIWAPLGLSSVAATVVGVARYKPRRRVAWYLLASAQFSLIAGDTAYNVLTQVLHQDDPFPSIADAFYLLTYPLAGAGIFLFIRGRSAMRDPASLIDAVIITTGLGLLSWVYLVVPNFQAPGLTGLQRFTSVAYPLGDILVLAILARLVGGGGLRIRSMAFLVVGAAGLLIADVLYGLIQLNGVWNVGGPVDGGWVIFYIAWGCAALHPSMARLGESRPRDTLRKGRVRVLLLASVSLIAPAVLLIDTGTGTGSGAGAHARTIGLFSAALFLLVIARLWGMLSLNEHSVERERTLRSSSERLVAAQGLDAIYQVALGGVIALTGATGVSHAAIYLADPDGGVDCVARSGEPPPTSRRRDLWRAAVAGGELNTTGTLSVTPILYDLKTTGMLVVDTAAPLTLDQHGALATLAAQVALAVESAGLAEDLRQRQNEERFKGILQNTSDIIVIVSARGEITYATPSLGRNLDLATEGLLGRPLAQLLQDDDAAEATALFARFAQRMTQTQSIVDWRLRHRDGTLMAFEVLSTNLLEDPSVGGIVLTMRDVSERRALEVQLKHQAFHDALTGLPNRALFSDRAEHALARTADRGTFVGMIMLDLDDFKNVNDTRGHSAGDQLLVQIASRLRAALRVDSTVSRFGGDEFAVLIEDVVDVESARRVAERALGIFAQPFTVHDEELQVGASVGLVVTGGPDEALDITELVRRADLALYAAKDRGKGKVMLYHSDLSTRMLDRVSRRADFERAMDAHEFVLYYQPIVSIETGEVVGCEALVRWAHPRLGLLPPVEFIEIAEATGLIVELGRRVLDQSCAQLRAWSDAGQTGLRLCVNVSARQLHEADFVDDVQAAILRHDVGPGELVLELTESIFALDAPGISAKLRALRDAGVKVAMDDFGTGYSSLAYLQKFQVDILKIDKSFVDGLGDDDLDGSALVNAIISLAHSLRLEVVAEGIESAAQRDELWSMGCTLGQGYLYSRPVELERMSTLLAISSQLGPLTPTGQRDVARLRLPALHSVPPAALHVL